ncbi:MAG: endonuclease/exonuclease/phosphatase family protein [Planctomycetes bacterium]|nr:endonuclease/exonuclease/phosphatase family protein [Planctomycetota bacterium]
MPALLRPAFAAALASAIALALFAARLLPPALRWPCTLFHEFEPFWMLGGPILLSLAFCGRRDQRGRLALVLAGALTILAFAVHGDALFERAPERPNSRAPETLRVATWNLGDVIAPADRAVAGISALGADIVALQEVSSQNRSAIESQLKHLYPHQEYYGAGLDGTALLTRAPLQDRGLIAPPGFRPMIRGKVDFSGRSVEVRVAHLSPFTGFLGTRARRGTHVEVLTQGVAALGPALLVGDLNSTERNGACELLQDAGWLDAWSVRGAGLGWTFPVPGRWRLGPIGPLVAIDHIRHTEHLEPIAVWLERDDASDHFPLVADLRWRERP